MKGNVGKDITIMVVILMSSMALVAPASSSSTIVYIESASVPVGQSITLPLMVKGAEEPISCARVILSYNSSVFKVTEDSINEGDFDSFVSSIENGKITIVCFQIGGEGLKGDFKLADIAFEAKKEGICELGVNVLELKNNKGDPVHAKSVNGSLAAEEDEGVPEPTTTPSITPTTIPAVPSPFLSPSPTPPSPSLTPTPSPSLITTTPTFTPIPLFPAGSKALVHIGNFSIAEGKTCNAVIIIKNVEHLSRANILLEYDSSIVKIESVGGSEFNKFAWDMPSEGKIKMFAFGETGGTEVKGDIKLAELKLRAIGKENESSELRLTVKGLKDGNNHDVPCEVKNGCLEVKPSSAIPALSVFEMSVVIAVFYYLIMRRKR